MLLEREKTMKKNLGMKKTVISGFLALVLLAGGLSSCGKATSTNAPASSGESTVGEEKKLFDFDIEEYLVLPDVSRLSVKRSEVAEKVEENYTQLLDNFPEIREKTEGTVETGDTVYIYYAGTLIPYDGDYSFTVGQCDFAGLDKALENTEFLDGEAVLKVTLPEEFTLPEILSGVPEDLAQELSGKSVTLIFSVEGKNGKAEKGEELTGNLRMEYVFGGGTYNADSAAEKAKKEGEPKGFGLEIGSGSFIDGFEDAMIGMSVQEGTKKVLTLKFPDPYKNNPALAGLPVEFEVTVLSATHTLRRDLTDPAQFALLKKEFEEINGEGSFSYEDDAKLREYIRTSVLAEFARQIAFEETVVREYEPETLEEYVAFAKKSFLQYYSNYFPGVTEEMLIQYIFKGEEAYKSQMEAAAKERMKQDLMLVGIARKNNLDKLTEEECNERLDRVIAQQKAYNGVEMTREEVVEELYGGRAELEKELLSEKTLEGLAGGISIEEDGETGE